MKKLFILGTLCLFFSVSALSQSKQEWEKIQSMNSWNAYQQFILNYPNGKYTEEAKQKQSLLEQPAPVNTVEETKVAAEVPAAENIVAAPADSLKNGGQILIKKKRYYLNDNQLNNKELKSLLLNDPASVDEYNIAKKNMTIGAVPMFAGMGLIFYGIIVMYSSSAEEADALENGGTIDQSKWVVPILAGCGLVVAGLPFMVSSNKHMKKSVSNYNAKRTAGYYNNQKLELGITQNGLRMIYRF